MAPRQRLQLHPDLGVAGIQILVLEVPGGAPLLDERRIARVHLALTGHQPCGEALEHLDEELVDRAEVVVDEALVGAGLGGQPACTDPGVSDLHEQALGGVEEGLGRRAARRLRRGGRWSCFH